MRNDPSWFSIVGQLTAAYFERERILELVKEQQEVIDFYADKRNFDIVGIVKENTGMDEFNAPYFGSLGTLARSKAKGFYRTAKTFHEHQHRSWEKIARLEELISIYHHQKKLEELVGKLEKADSAQ